MTTPANDAAGAEVATAPQLPKKAQFSTSWNDPMPDRAANASKLNASKLTGPLAKGGVHSGEVSSVWYDFGTEQNPGRVFIVKYGPGYTAAVHSHDTDYCSIVVEGSMEVTRRKYERGDIRFVKAETAYGPIVVGPEGATVIEFFPGPPDGRDQGAPPDDNSPRREPYEYFTAAARRAFLPPWVS